MEIKKSKNKSRHPSSIFGLDAKTFSEKIVQLRFDYMADLFGHFNDALRKMAELDASNGRTKLSIELRLACTALQQVTDHLDAAWEISKNKTSDEEYDLFNDFSSQKNIIKSENNN